MDNNFLERFVLSTIDDLIIKVEATTDGFHPMEIESIENLRKLVKQAENGKLEDGETPQTIDAYKRLIVAFDKTQERLRKVC